MKIHYVTGSRADFGLMERCLRAIADSGRHRLELVVTGQHLSAKYGASLRDIEASGLPVAARLPVRLEGQSGAEMGLALAEELAGMIGVWSTDRPDLVLLLGDRGEMLAGALAAVHLGLHVAHIHGGERSGTLDESFRHCISKLAHIHLPATAESGDRLRQMGESPDVIHVIGAPGLVGLTDGVSGDRDWLKARFGFQEGRPVALVVFHPVVQEAASAAAQIGAVLSALDSLGCRIVAFRPNSDGGGAEIDAVLDRYDGKEGFVLLSHLPRDEYLRTLASCDVMVGNSSSGIIESASFGVPCVNIGARQNDRQRNTNTVDCPEPETGQIRRAVERALGMTGPFPNVYGDGLTDRHLLSVLDYLVRRPEMLSKRNAY